MLIATTRSNACLPGESNETQLLSAVALLTLAAAVHAQEAPEITLHIGDKAPALTQGDYVKGEAVRSFEAGKVYVIECWATWCGPCIEAIPHVTSLQKKYADKGLIVIGQDVWEQRDDSKVIPFVEKMGEKMDYRVAKDTAVGQGGMMATNWLRAAGRDSIPSTFVVDQKGVIAWIGHPMELDEPLAKIISGDFDVAASKTAYEAEQAKMLEQRRVMAPLQKSLREQIQKADADGAMATIDKIAAASEMDAPDADVMRFEVLMAMKSPDLAYTHAEKAIAASDDAMLLNRIAWNIVKPKSALAVKNYDVAIKAAQKAVEVSKGKDAAVIDTLARAYFAKGDKAMAIETQEKAVAAAGDNAELKTELQATLASYQS